MARSRDSRPPVPAGWSLRPLADADRAALLRLNAGNYPSVHTLDRETLDWLLAFDGGHHLVAVNPAGAVLGYLLSFVSASAYDDSEISELRWRVARPFCYICQVVVAPAQPDGASPASSTRQWRASRGRGACGSSAVM